MKRLFLVVTCINVLFIFRAWLLPTILVGGDTVHIYSMDLFNPIPYLWDIHNSNGFGSFVGPFLNAQFVTTILWFLGNILHLQWSTMERIVFLFPDIILGILISLKVTNYFLGRKLSNTLAPLIFLLNTYFLLLVAGGQIVVAFSYVLVPYVFYRFALLFKTLLQKNIDTKLLLKQSLLAGFMLSVEIIFDIRIAFLVVLIVTLYGLYTIIFAFSTVKKRIGQIVAFTIVFPLLAIICLHAFWLVPTLMVHQNTLQQLGSAYTSVASVQFLSFAKFENSFGLLHPNWPENIFGKTYFMRPEFLLLPILAFMSLFFVGKERAEEEKQRNILFFALLGLIGIFLAKGANDPFGGVYLWMFDHVPGFVMFRDATKWYIFIILSYLILIPFTIDKITQYITDRFERTTVFSSGIMVIVILIFCWTIRPAFLGQLPGLLHTHVIPNEYQSLASYLSTDTKFSRVLWVPTFERYGYFSRQHPSVNALTYFHATSLGQLLQDVQNPQEEAALQDASIKYIIVPFDAEQEIFLKNRKYDPKQYNLVIQSLRKVSWLKEISGFGRIHVFEIPNVKDHIWILQAGNTKVQYIQISPTKYYVTITNAHEGDKLIFSDSYDPTWQLQIGNLNISSAPFEKTFNSFVLPQNGTYRATLYYAPQKWVIVGIIVSCLTMAVLAGIVFYVYKNYL